MSCSRRPLPVIDVSALLGSPAGEESEKKRAVALAMESACRINGFFYIKGHGIPTDTLRSLDGLSREFFALSQLQKMEISMAKGGRAWRGYFPVGGELTSGRPDEKEGLYFGTELPAEDPRVVAALPLHGQNLWPLQVPGLLETVTQYMTQTTAVAQAVLRGIALSLDLDEGYFQRFYTADPTVLFRIFHYPASSKTGSARTWGVGEHTDYGLLTLLAQDEQGGLEVKSQGQWIEAPPIEGTLVCNIGDMLDRLTGGWYVSTPHRVQASSHRNRLSFPLFLDPEFGAVMRPLPLLDRVGHSVPRWDETNLHAFEGTYGDYLLSKVAKVFPQLGADAL